MVFAAGSKGAPDRNLPGAQATVTVVASLAYTRPGGEAAGNGPGQGM
ncbi:MAG: hypothetical protein WBN81_07075 [Gammaproteobacteria bacterium]